MAVFRRLVPVLTLAAATLVFVGVSAAVEGGGATPSDGSPTDSVDTTSPMGTCATDTTSSEGGFASDDGCETTDTTVAAEVGDEGAVGDDAEEVEKAAESDEGVAPEPPEGDRRPANHGAVVSEAAHTCPPGPDHGACVSAVARSDAGKSNVDHPDDDHPDDETGTGAPPANPKPGKGGARNGRGPR